MSEQLSASEALYGFAGWLTSRAEETVMSARAAAPIAERVDQFCKENSLTEPREDWSGRLVHPHDAV